MEKVDNKKELSMITLELLDRTNELKNSILNSMVIGDSSIVMGIDIFEEMLIKINPSVINEEVTQYIHNSMENELINYRGNFRLINNYVRNGVEYCYSILYYYEKNCARNHNIYSKTRKKNKINR